MLKFGRECSDLGLKQPKKSKAASIKLTLAAVEVDADKLFKVRRARFGP
jgi:hypothetical protein